MALGLAPCYLLYHGMRPNPTFAHAPRIGSGMPLRPSGHLEWLLYPLLKYGNPAPSDMPLPDDYSLHLPANGIHRVRRGLLGKASFFRDATRLLWTRSAQPS